ncbi:MAG: NAD-dependent epimerase/dehydratase family protein, partial [Rubrobacteraceae bacterium]
SHLCDRLRSLGAKVIGIDNLLTGRLDNLAHLRPVEDSWFRVDDVTRPFEVAGPVDFVLHLASPASPRDYLRHPLATLKVGSAGTLNALELAATKRARFLLASTSEVYGDPLVHPQSERDWGNVNPIGPRSVYDEAKRFAEALTSCFEREGNAQTHIVRIFNTYGPRMRADDGRAVPTFISQALAGEPITVSGDGNQTRSLSFVSDTVDGLIAAAMGRHPGPVNIGNPHEITMLQLAEEIRTMTGSSSEIVSVQVPVDDPKRRCPDITLAREHLGWEPTTHLSDGLHQTIDWMRQHHREPISSTGRNAS